MELYRVMTRVIEKSEILINKLFIFSVIILLYCLFWGFYFRDDWPSFKIKYWVAVSFFYIIFLIISLLAGYKSKFMILQKEANLKDTYIISIIYLILFLVLGWILTDSIYSINTNVLNISILFIILFIIPVLIMLLDAFYFIPADEFIQTLQKTLFSYSITPALKKSDHKDQKYFLTQKEEDKPIIEQIFPKNFNPILKLLIIILLLNIFFNYSERKITNIAIESFFFFFYYGVFLIYWRKKYYTTVSELKDSMNLVFETKNTTNKFIRRSAYIFLYSYFVYWVLAASRFGNFGLNYFDALMLSVLNGDFIISFNLLIYFILMILIISMMSDGFGILPIISNVSREIVLQIEKIGREINLFHPDKTAGFKSLGNFCFGISFAIAFPFIIGMPIQLYRYSTNIYLQWGIINYIIDDSLNILLIGFGFVGATMFIILIYYLNRLIVTAKEKKLKELTNIYNEEFKDLSNLSFAKILFIENKMKKLESITLPPYGTIRVIAFYGPIIISMLANVRVLLG